MAKIKFSVGISAASGKVGGNVFSRNGSGAYLKSFSMPVNPNTTRQQAVRAAFATQVATWRNLTSAQQQLWKDIAPQYPAQDALGNQIQYSGQQLYIKLNQSLTTAGLTAITSPLVPQSFSALVFGDFTMTNTAGVLTAADVEISAAGTSDESFIVTMTPSLSAGITSPGKSSFRKVFTENDASSGATLDVVTAYQALYGNPELGTKVFASVTLLNNLTGQRLNLGRLVTVVAGT